MQKIKKVCAAVLAAALVMSSVAVPSGVQAAKKPVLSKKKITVQVDKTVKIKVNRAKKATISWKSSKKKVASVKKSGKYACKITGVKAGKAVITCKVKKGSKVYTAKCNVTVKGKQTSVSPASTPTATAFVTAAPTSTPAASTVPTSTATAAPVVTEAPSLQGTYVKAGIFQYMGTCLSYSNGQLSDDATMSHVTSQYNSFTLENEMKPDTILRNSSQKLITVEEAKNLGYTIPDNYTEATVPDLNFASADNAMTIAYSKGLKMRGHTLMWHSQTPAWFFNTDYKSGGSAVSEEVMNARLEFYVRTVMDHVMKKEIELSGSAGSIVYAWDVLNEYNHRSNSGWERVYGNLALEPLYAKKAFQYAYDELKKNNAQDKVTLYSNDYDTYFCVEKELALVNYINKDEETNICGGIGMQSHVDVDRPTLDEYKTALQAFINTGLEVSITEFDATINWDHLRTYDYKNENQTNEDQAAFIKDFMEMVVTLQRDRDTTVSPKGIVGFTLWGLYDSVSWRGKSTPLLFGTSINDVKPSFQTFLDAAKLWNK